MTAASIRAKLMLFLFGGMTCGIIITLSATYWAVRTQIGRVFDSEMQQVAEAVHVREDWLDKGRVRIARPGFSFAVRAYDPQGHMYFETAYPALPDAVPQTFAQGYERVESSSGRWRIYTHVAPEGIVQVGQPVATRDALARDLSLRVILPLVLLVPITALVVIWGLRRGLAPLGETTKRVGQRDASALDPLPVESVPAEIVPLVEQINALMVRLSSALDGQRRFLADAAHELRTPVGAITLQAQLAERAPSRLERQAAFAELRLGMDRIRRIVQQLLDLARLDPGVDQQAFTPVDLAALARELVGSFSVHAEAAGIDIDLGAEAPTSCFIMGNETQLRSMISNLIDNALRYAPPHSSVTVSVRQHEHTVQLDVIDAGPGIPVSERESVFQRFHRIAGDRSPGNGLGLSIVKAVVRRHEGALTLNDAVVGATPPGLRVTIELPAAPPFMLAAHARAA